VAAAQAFDQVQLPKRPLHVERLRHHPADQVAELVEPPRLRHRDVADVAAHFELRIVPPDRVLDAERDLHDPLPEPRDQQQSLLDVPDQLVVGRRGPLDDDVPPTCTWIGPRSASRFDMSEPESRSETLVATSGRA
jgi:hypothetical protein